MLTYMADAIASQDEQDDLLIQRALDPENPFDLNRELELGEKAEDAVDFGDLSNDDLADDEEEGHLLGLSTRNATSVDSHLGDPRNVLTKEEWREARNLGCSEGDGIDDLFGDIASSPVDDVEERRHQLLSARPTMFDESVGVGDDHQVQSGLPMEKPSSQNKELPLPANRPVLRPVTFNNTDVVITREQQLQRNLFAMSGYSVGEMDILPPPPENQEQLLVSLWPKFQRSAVPKFMEILPPKKIRYSGKKPFKRPKAVQPTKVNLELGQDQEKSFMLPLDFGRKTQEDPSHTGIVSVPDLSLDPGNSDESEEIYSDSESKANEGVTWQDMQIVCQDWEIVDFRKSRSPHQDDEFESQDRKNSCLEASYPETVDHLGWQSLKKRKLCHVQVDFPRTPQFSFPLLHDPEKATSKLSKRVTLDLNDSRLLIDNGHPNFIARSHVERSDLNQGTRIAFVKGLNQRYNISNDAAYDLLKENHQSKVRSTLGNLMVEHSTPAVRLQWPYYKTKLEKQEARSFHRPTIKFQRNEQIAFSKPRTVKRKHLKGKDVRKIFESTRDLSLGDNSNLLLLEYSEEHPTMMSNFGMGSRLINYYRRKNMEDVSRPKLEVGETAVLLPQDKSPFSVFGHIDPGQIAPALYNGMFRAPIFKQYPKFNDFVVVRNTTGIDGPTWYIRVIENLHIAGQEFPSVDVPGPHSRKVTTAAKNRLKMISYRQIRRKPIHRISVAEVTKHFIDTTDMQNRQKMKEFMQFSKEHKEWEMRPGEAIPDEDTIRALVKPEDVCLLESMQVGQQHLRDAGFSKGDDDSEEDDGKEDRSIEQQLAPWYTTRNFINAAQGKAMLQLHGEGDPSGRGEAFNFIKTSMKGGFKAMGESVEDKLDAKKLKELGGHSYNVARQQRSYEESIRRIWDAQKQSLSSTIDQSDVDMDDDHIEEGEDSFGDARTPQSEALPPTPFRRRDDETTSQFSKFSTDSQAGKVLRITREVRDQYGNLKKTQDVIRDLRVIKQYLKRRHAKEAEGTTLSELKPTGDAEQDRRNQQRLEKELARLQRNKDRRLARDKQKGPYTDDAAANPPHSPSSPATSVPAPRNAGTQRKCANCGQVGHIKTNKKLCPMLNGTMKQEDNPNDSAFAIGAPAI